MGAADRWSEANGHLPDWITTQETAVLSGFRPEYVRRLVQELQIGVVKASLIEARASELALGASWSVAQLAPSY